MIKEYDTFFLYWKPCYPLKAPKAQKIQKIQKIDLKIENFSSDNTKQKNLQFLFSLDTFCILMIKKKNVFEVSAHLGPLRGNNLKKKRENNVHLTLQSYNFGYKWVWEGLLFMTGKP